jgi:hypothetical protein
MIPRRLVRALAVAAPLALAGASCEKVPLLAPSGSSITLTASATTLPVNGTTPLLAQVIEASGTVPHSGTHVSFTTTLGAVQPDSGTTDINGQVRVTFVAGNASGTATITATSGGAGGAATGTGSTTSASNQVKIAIGAAAVGHVSVVASPAAVPAAGGDATITANVLDTNGSPLASVAVSFSTTAGTLSSAFESTDADGRATTVLHTATQATVTASVGTGAASGGGTGGSTSGTSVATVTIGVNGAPTLAITPPAGGVTANLPATFTFAVAPASTNGSAVQDVKVDWGDGNSEHLGAISGSNSVVHTYHSAGSYSIAAVVTDANGNSVSVTVPVLVNPPALTLVISAPSGSLPGAGVPTSFTFTPGVPAGDSVKNISVDWGDPGSDNQDLGAVTGSIAVQHVYAAAGPYVITGVLTDVFGNSVTSSAPVTVVATAQPTVIVTPTAPGAGHPIDVSVQIQVTTPSGVSIQSATINWNDGGVGGSPGPSADQNLGGVNGTITVHHTYTAAGSFTITVTVTDTLGRQTSGTASVSIS